MAGRAGSVGVKENKIKKAGERLDDFGSISEPQVDELQKPCREKIFMRQLVFFGTAIDADDSSAIRTHDLFVIIDREYS